MLMSFKNVLKEKVDKVYFNEASEERERYSSTGNVDAILITPEKLISTKKHVDDKEAFAVAVGYSGSMVDPRVFFTDLGDAQRFYDDVVAALVSERIYAEFDVLEYGAI